MAGLASPPLSPPRLRPPPASWRGRGHARRHRATSLLTIIAPMVGVALAAALVVAFAAWMLADWAAAQGVADQAPAGRAPGSSEVRVTWATCRALVEHVPSADVKYRPGTDAAGHRVAPADLNPRPEIKVPETITIPITVDLCQRYSSTENVKLCHTPFARDGVTARPFDTHVPPAPGKVQPYDVEGPRQRYDAPAYIGTITVKGDGRRAYLDGQPLTDTESALMREACQRQYPRMR